MNTDELPKAKYTGKLRIGDLEIDVVVLEDGRRIIPEADMFRVIQWLGIPDEDIEAFFLQRATKHLRVVK